MFLPPLRLTQNRVVGTARSFSGRGVQHPYFVPRNTRGNLPVYSDIRNGGTRYLISIHNVDGNTKLLAKDLAESLFKRESPEFEKLRIEIVRGKNLVVAGGHWKHHIVHWLKAKGF